MSSKNTEIKVTLVGKNNTGAMWAEASMQMGKARKDAESLSAGFALAGRAMNVAVAGVSAMGAMSKHVIDETSRSQREQGQLVAALRATGETAGWTQQQLNEMAGGMSSRSIFSTGEITQAQTSLLEFTGIYGEQFPRAVQVAADMAASRGIDIVSATEMIGHALRSPSQGLETLSLLSLQLSDDQKALVQSLEETGETAAAQAALLDALEESFEGSANAARDTFGGAVTALGNQLSSLTTGSDGSLDGAASKVNELSAALASPETRKAFESVVGWAASLSTALVGAATNIVSFISSNEKLALMTGTDTFTRTKMNAQASSRKLTTLTDKAIQMQDEIVFVSADITAKGGNADKDPWVEMKKKALEDLRARISDVKREAANASEALKAMGNPVVAGAVPQKTGVGSITPEKREVDGHLNTEKRPTPPFKKQAGTKTDTAVVSPNSRTKRSVAVEPEDGLKNLLSTVEEKQVARAREATESYAQENQRMRENLEQIGLNAEALLTLQQRRLDDAIAIKTQALADAVKSGADQRELEAIEKQIALMYERKELLGSTAAAESAKKDVDLINSLTLQAASAIESRLGSGVRAALDGNFKGISGSWSDMLKDMAAQAAAAKLSEWLLGDYKSTNKLGGLVGLGVDAVTNFFSQGSGQGVASMFSSLAGNRASGGGVGAGKLYEVNETDTPELLTSGGRTFLMMGSQDGWVTPTAQAAGAAMATGGSPVVNVNFSGTNERPQVSASVGVDGAFNIDVVFAQFASRMGQDIAQGIGPLYQGQKTRFGLRDA